MIFEFSDYRSWLRHELMRRIKENPNYSATSFSRRLGISQAYLSLLLNGSRPLTEGVASKVKSALKLNEKEGEYLQLLLRKEEAKHGPLVATYERELAHLKQDSGYTDLSLESFRAMSAWECSAVLEALNIEGCDSPDAVRSKLLLPKKVVLKSLKTLKKIGLVKEENGKWHRVSQSILQTPTDLRDEALRGFHRQVLRKALHAIDAQDVTKRNISGMTMAIDPEKLPEAKQRIQKFVHELTSFLESGRRTKVYQISVSLFELINDEATEDFQ